MDNHEQLVKALRCKSDDCEGCYLAFFDKDEGWMCQYAAKDDDAADAIEALNRLVDLNTERCEALRKQLREAHESYEKHINELEAQLPKRGEWIETEEKEWGIYPFKKHTCSVCDCKIDHIFMLACMDYFDDRDTVFHYCPNCGAKMNDSNASNALNALDNAQDGPIITPCRGCSDYDGYGGCKSKGGCARAKKEVQDADK